MAKYYGDLPCVRIGNTIHITENAFKCVCGQSWSYGRPTERESLHNNNIIWRDISAVSCEKCRSLAGMILQHSIVIKRMRSQSSAVVFLVRWINFSKRSHRHMAILIMR